MSDALGRKSMIGPIFLAAAALLVSASSANSARILPTTKPQIQADS